MICNMILQYFSHSRHNYQEINGMKKLRGHNAIYMMNEQAEEKNDVNNKIRIA